MGWHWVLLIRCSGCCKSPGCRYQVLLEARSHQSLLCRHVVNIPTRGVGHDDVKIDYRHDTYDTLFVAIYMKQQFHLLRIC
jgi:hypothetical protein